MGSQLATVADRTQSREDAEQAADLSGFGTTIHSNEGQLEPDVTQST